MNYDKELIINGKAVRSPEQQVYKNMKDIEELKNIITLEEEYACTIDLATTATTVAKSYTNAGEEVKSGWLIDPHANKFKITGGDDSNLLIEFYASYRGPAGEDGVSAIDDTGTAEDKVWSSDKTDSEIAKARDKGIYYTITQPSEVLTDVYNLLLSNVANVNSNISIKPNDLIIYINASGNPEEIYKVNSLLATTLGLSKVGTYAQGKTLYKHTITIENIAKTIHAVLDIINDNNTSFTISSLLQYLYDNNYKILVEDGANQKNNYLCFGHHHNASNQYFVVTEVNYYDVDTFAFYGCMFSAGSFSRIGTFTTSSISVVQDHIIQL